MSCKLVQISTDCEKIIAHIARVSNPKNQHNENIQGLINYCIVNGHWSVFEQGMMTVEIETSRAISAQIIRHRSFCFQEFSQRYAVVEDAFEIPALRRQDLKNRQNSIDDIDDKMKTRCNHLIKEHYEQTKRLYHILIDEGVAKECARMILPMSSKTRLYMTGNIRNWIHYLKVRCDISTQKEHRDIAESIKQIFIKELPLVSEALGWI